MNGDPAAILAVIHQPCPSVVFELVPSRQPPTCVQGVIACNNSPVGVPELDQPLGLHEDTVLRHLAAAAVQSPIPAGEHCWE